MKQDYMYNGKMIIGIDHGYGNMKTANTVFKSGVEEYSTEPVVSKNYVQYKDKYYVVGESHLTYDNNKTMSEDYFILTLAALGEEMIIRDKTRGEVVIAAGLPLAWAKNQALSFKEYLLRDRELHYSYKGKNYDINVSSVELFPQSFAPICVRGSLPGMNMVVDIGNGTMNIMRINDNRPIENSVVTERYGVSICVSRIKKELSKTLAENIPEEIIEPILIHGVRNKDDRISKVVGDVARSYVGEIEKQLKDYGYNKEHVRLFVLGGGGCLLKNFSSIMNCNCTGIVFIDDICANAKAYEQLAYQKLRSQEKKYA